MKRTSKYLFASFGNWTCTHIGVNNVQGKNAKAPYHQNYYYVFERLTSDGKANKMIRLNSSETSKVYKGLMTVEDILNKRELRNETRFSRKVSYHFLVKKA